MKIDYDNEIEKLCEIKGFINGVFYGLKRQDDIFHLEYINKIQDMVNLINELKKENLMNLINEMKKEELEEK